MIINGLSFKFKNISLRNFLYFYYCNNISHFIASKDYIRVIITTKFNKNIYNYELFYLASTFLKPYCFKECLKINDSIIFNSSYQNSYQINNYKDNIIKISLDRLSNKIFSSKDINFKRNIIL